MRVLFVSYWGLNEGLTQATIIPHLDILARDERINQIDFITIERKGEVEALKADKVSHYQIYTSEQLLSKIFDGRKVASLLKKLYAKDLPKWILARGSMAAMMVFGFARKKKIPISIESFEPHAQYMIESGVWSESGWKYRMLLRSENRQKRFANWLLPVTHKYGKHLVEREKVDEAKIMVMPCCVHQTAYAFNPSERAKVRARLQIDENAFVAIYTGKLGGIYLNDEAIKLFMTLKEFIGESFFLMILSPDQSEWKSQLIGAGFSSSQFHVGFVSKQEVSSYLSASDIAFSLHKPSPSKMAISPIKNAEYWANGLPVVMPQGIGDDSELTDQRGLGVVLSRELKLNQKDCEALVAMSKDNRTQNSRVVFAETERSFQTVADNYDKIIAKL